MSEFKIDSYGIDISQNAINEAKLLSKFMDLKADFRVYDGEKIPFENGFFDFAISYGVLDSMPYALAKNLLKEIERVVKKYFFLSLIGEDSSSLFSNIQGDFTGEIEVQDAHEFGTIQSFFDEKKIQDFIKGSKFEMVFGQKMQHTEIKTGKKYSRYFIVLQKEALCN